MSTKSDQIQLVASATQSSTQLQGETDAEVEEEEHEREHRHKNDRPRVTRLLTNFIERYLRGIASPDFQVLAGVEVMTQNYVIFGHLLWRLLERDWVAPETVLESFLDMWKVFWGQTDRRGYWHTLDESQQAWSTKTIQQYHADAQFLATLFVCAKVAEYYPESDFHVASRQLWRSMLTDRPLSTTPESLEFAWRLVARLQAYDPPRPSAICNLLAGLANRESRDHFLRALEQRYEAHSHRCRIRNEYVFRAKYDRTVPVDCLSVPDKNWLCDLSAARELLRRWLRAEPALDYYRIHAPEAKQIIFFDKHDHELTYWDKEKGEPQTEYGPLRPLPMPWDVGLQDLLAIADALDDTLVLSVDSLEPSVSSSTIDNG